MTHVSFGAADAGAAGKPVVQGLFVASFLLSIVSWYTTWQGMALYLSGWFALLASLGVQLALLLVAWLIGFSKNRRTLLIAVYIITGLVSVAFSYVSLFTWFSQRERPAIVERQLFDRLNTASQKSEELISAAIAEQKRHVLALEEMTRAEKTVGHIARAQDSDPYLAKAREAVAREAQTYADSYREGAGVGVRYTAFDRFSKLARETLGSLEASSQRLTAYRTAAQAQRGSEEQLRRFHQAYDTVPWKDVEEVLHSGAVERPNVPTLTEFVDRTASGQEDLMLAFSELFTEPTGRHLFSLTLAAFIDIIVFLLAFSSGPYFFGSPDTRWRAAAAAMDSSDDQVFTRNLLRKMEPGPTGTVRVDSTTLTPGERQFILVLVGKSLAATSEENGRTYFVIDAELHESLMDSLATRSMPLRADTQPSTAT